MNIVRLCWYNKIHTQIKKRIEIYTVPAVGGTTVP